jgi:hypothetical protein
MSLKILTDTLLTWKVKGMFDILMYFLLFLFSSLTSVIVILHRAHKAGIAKIIPPPEWKPCPNGYNMEAIGEMEIPAPISQV